jgi:hypothetical protein
VVLFSCAKHLFVAAMVCLICEVTWLNGSRSRSGGTTEIFACCCAESQSDPLRSNPFRHFPLSVAAVLRLA